MRTSLVLLFLILLSVQSISQTTRKDILNEKLPLTKISKVEVKEITMAPLQHAPLHKHPCAVVGYVVKGTLLFQLEGGRQKILKKGAAFYEPAGEHVRHFDNASKDQPLVFVAFYLKEEDDARPLVEVIDQSK